MPDTNTPIQTPQTDDAQQNVPVEPVDDNTANDQNAAPVEPAEKTISKAIYDKKVAEMNKQLKEYKQKLDAKMTDDEKLANAQQEAEDALRAAQNEAYQLRTEKALAAAGIAGDTAEKLAAAIVGGDAEDIVSAITEALTANEKAVTAKTKAELLKNGSPKVPSGNNDAPADPMFDKIKSIQSAKVSSGQTRTSKWMPKK